VGNGGWSGWIDEFGKIRGVLKNKAGSVYFRGTDTYAITRDSRWANQPSFYAQHGDWLVAVSLLLAVLGGSVLFFSKTQPVPAIVPEADVTQDLR
jgi:apolipoprotein N-acyltransferase